MPSQRDLRFVGVDRLAEPAAGAECQAEELQLVGGRSGAVAEKLEALVPHFGVLLVGHQLDAVVERTHGRHQVMAEPRAQEAG